VTLELSNVATLPIKLWPGMKIGQLCFFRLSSPAEAPYGSGRPAPATRASAARRRRGRSRASTARRSSWVVALSSAPLQSRLARILYADALVGIAVTGIVHWVLLRPLLSLDGADWWADKLLHVVVPLLAIVVWLAVGPRGRVRSGDVGWAVVPPVLWLVYTLARGAATEFYPYPFLDAGAHGYPAVFATCAGVAALFLALAWAAARLDRKLSARSEAHAS
jgi:hypothetical protein